MEKFALSAMIAGIPLSCGTFEASGESEAIGFGRGYVEALCEIRPAFEIGSRWRVDRLVLRGNEQFIDETTLVAECEVVEREARSERSGERQLRRPRLAGIKPSAR